MNKLRAFFKILLADTVLYSLAKSTYIRMKLFRDKRAFVLAHPQAQCINYQTDTLHQLKEDGYYSQYGQDHFIWSHYLSKQAAGVFIDIGANKPDKGNNSFFFETQGWKGIAIDPLTCFQQEWANKRSTPLICGAVSDNERDELFVEFRPKQGWEHALSGFKQHIRAEDLKIYDFVEYMVSAKPLHEYVPKDQHVDIILIDVEGAELEVLKGIDFSALQPTFILLENDDILGGSPQIRNYLHNQGYECITRIAATDDLFKKITQ